MPIEHKYEVIFRRPDFCPVTRQLTWTLKRVTTYARDAEQAIRRVLARLPWKYMQIPICHIGLVRFNLKGLTT